MNEKTAILFFQGGDNYGKQMQIKNILREETNSFVFNVKNYDELDTYLPLLHEDGFNKIIVFHKERLLEDFESSMNAEFGKLFETIEVLPEGFFRLQEADMNVGPTPISTNSANIRNTRTTQNTQVSKPNLQQTNVQQPTALFPNRNFIEGGNYFLSVTEDINTINNGGLFGLIVDPNNGYWFPTYSSMLKFFPNYNKGLPEGTLQAPLDYCQQNFVNDQSAGRKAAPKSAQIYQNIKLITSEAKNKPRAWADNEEIKRLNLLSKDDKEATPHLIRKAFVTLLMYNSVECDKVDSKLTKVKKDKDSEGADLLDILGFGEDVKVIMDTARKAGLGLVMDFADWATRGRKTTTSTDSEETTTSSASGKLGQVDGDKKQNGEQIQDDPAASFLALDTNKFLDQILKGSKFDDYNNICKRFEDGSAIRTILKADE